MKSVSLCLFRLLFLFALIFLTSHAVSQTKPSPLPSDYLDGPPLAEVLVLGTFHMGNPGKDIINMKADDVLSPQRQAEIREVLDVLVRFRPTKIAVESSPGSQRIQQYQKYLSGKYELSRNEHDQIGFRLGKELNLPKIYGIDSGGEFPFPSVQDYAKAHGREKELDSLKNKVGKMVQDDNEFLKSHTILQMLLRINMDDAVRRNLASYAMFAHFGEKSNYVGGKLLTEWYQRNMCIHTNLLNIIEQGDRVLVIYGSGHLGLMRLNVQADPTLSLRTIEEFAATAK
jgi:hypothetical protein